MKHIVYKTTNLINGKIYIGIHTTENEFDKYLGSGRIFLKAIKKYGKENFKKEILYTYTSRIDALNKEKEIVNEEFILNDSNYNCTIGGKGGIGKSNKGRKHTKEAIEKIREAGKRKCTENTKYKIGNANRGRKMKQEFVLQNSLLRKKYYETHKSTRLGIKHTEETNKKISEKLKGRKMNECTKNKISLALKGKSKKGKSIIDIRNNKIYKSIIEAVIDLKIPSRTLYRKIKNENYFLRYE